jgi:hypothetical protein
MDQVDSGNRSAAPSGARPSLFTNGPSAPGAASKQPEAFSILSSLDKSDGKKPLSASTGLPTWFTIAMGGLLGITIAAAIFISLSRDTGIERHAPTAPVVVARIAPPEKAPEPPAPAGAASAVAVNAAAAIENAPPAAVAPAPSALANSHPTASNTDKKPTEKASEPAPAASNQTASTAKPASEPAPAAAHQAASTTPAKTVPSEQPEPKTAKVPATKNTPAKAKNTKEESVATGAAPSDRDASLLAALVAYGEGKPAPDINKQAVPITGKSPSGKPSGGKTTVAQAGDGQFDPKRDVVVRESDVSTTELVRRCKTLGFFESLLCRMRVCSNLWGKDPACPQSSAPNASTP